MDILKGIRPVDYALATVMVCLAALLGVFNVTTDAGATDLARPLDSQSPLLVPVFMAAAAPVLWRRRHVLAAVGASLAVVAASVPAFGWVTRCGFGLPLSIALAYAVARFAGGRQRHVVGLAGVLLLQVVVLVRDASTGGLDPLTFSVPLAALAYGIGLFVQSRSSERADRPTLSPERVYA